MIVATGQQQHRPPLNRLSFVVIRQRHYAVAACENGSGAVADCGMAVLSSGAASVEDAADLTMTVEAAMAQVADCRTTEVADHAGAECGMATAEDCAINLVAR